MPETEGKKQQRPQPKRRPPLPGDAPLLSIEDVAVYLRTTPPAVRKMLDGRADSNDELGARLRPWLVKLSPHRRYIMREPFLAWLRQQAGCEVVEDGNVSRFSPSNKPSA